MENPEAFKSAMKTIGYDFTMKRGGGYRLIDPKGRETGWTQSIETLDYIDPSDSSEFLINLSEAEMDVTEKSIALSIKNERGITLTLVSFKAFEGKEKEE